MSAPEPGGDRSGLTVRQYSQLISLADSIRDVYHAMCAVTAPPPVPQDDDRPDLHDERDRIDWSDPELRDRLKRHYGLEFDDQALARLKWLNSPERTDQEIRQARVEWLNGELATATKRLKVPSGWDYLKALADQHGHTPPPAGWVSKLGPYFNPVWLPAATLGVISTRAHELLESANWLLNLADCARLDLDAQAHHQEASEGHHFRSRVQRGQRRSHQKAPASPATEDLPAPSHPDGPYRQHVNGVLAFGIRVGGDERPFQSDELNPFKMIEQMPWPPDPSVRVPVEQVKQRMKSRAGQGRWAENLARKTKVPLNRVGVQYHLKADETHVWWVRSSCVSENADPPEPAN